MSRSSPDFPSVSLNVDLQPLFILQKGEESLLAFAHKTGQLADFASKEFPQVILMKEAHQAPTKGVFEIVTSIVIALGVAVRAAKPLIDSLTLLIGKLCEVFPENEFVVIFPDGTKLRAKGRIGTDALMRFLDSVRKQLRDTDLAKLERSTYIITLKDHRSSD